MCRPVIAFHTRRRSGSVRIGVRVSTPSSWSHCRRANLSTIETACPRFDRYRAVAHPQYPSPPRIEIFMLVVPVFLRDSPPAGVVAEDSPCKYDGDANVLHAKPEDHTAK